MNVRYVNLFLAYFRTTARTVGLSPKALAPIIGGVLVAAVKLVGLDSDELAGVIGVIAASIAAVLLPPGDVIAPPPVAEPGSDALMPPHALEKLAD
jgi:hypothetical protein